MNPPPIPSTSPDTEGGLPPVLEPTRRPIPEGLTGVIEELLRHPEDMAVKLRGDRQGKILNSLILITLVCLTCYGLVVGSFEGGEQFWAAPVKIVLGTFLCAFMCLPSLFIFACFCDADIRFVEMRGLLYAAVALNSILMIGFAPVAWIFSQSTTSPAFMGAMHLVFWLIAVRYGLALLRRGFERFEASSFGHLRVWSLMFVLVMLQMTATLRPLIGTSETFLPVEKQFFVATWSEAIWGKK